MVSSTDRYCGSVFAAQLIPVVEPSTLSIRLRDPSWEQVVRPGAQETRLHPSPGTALHVFYLFKAQKHVKFLE